MKVSKVSPYIVPFLIVILILSVFHYQYPLNKPVINLNTKIVSECTLTDICVEINPNVELVEVVFYLAGWNNFSNSTYQYVRDVNNYFKGYKDHAAVKLAKKAIKKGLIYDAIPKFALELNSEEWSDYIVQRVNGDRDLLNKLAKAIGEFAKETNFTKFYNLHKEFYSAQIERFTKEHPTYKELPKFEEAFFGEKARGWHFVLQPLQLYYSYAGSFNRTIYGFIGICAFFNKTPIYCNASAHEFAHSFVNPAVSEYYREFRPYSDMFSPVKDVMLAMGYSNWHTYLEETLVRAFEAYYILKTRGNQSSERFIKEQEALGFYLVRRVYQAYLLDYLPNRDKYPTFRSFMPELAKLMGRWYRESFWKDVSPEPTIEVVFLAFKTGGVKVYAENDVSKKYVKDYVEKLKKAGFNAELTDKLEEGNLIVIVTINSSIFDELNKYVDMKGKEYARNIIVVEALKNPWRNGFVLLIAGTPNAFNEKTTTNLGKEVLRYHYFIYNKDLKSIVEFG